MGESNVSAKARRQTVRWKLMNAVKTEEAGEPLYKRQVDEEEDAFEDLYDKYKILKPPYSFPALYNIYEESDILQSCVEAMQNNIDGFGYQMVFLGDDVKEKNTTQAMEELLYITEFLDNVNENQSITTVRKKVREDIEVLGNGAFEVIRNRKGKIAMIYPVHFSKMRLCKTDKTPVTVTIAVPRGGKMVRIKVKKYFRRFVQISSSGKKLRWFKELGDPRLMDATTGEFISSGKPKIVASEIWHMKNSFGGSVYGLPRWIGAVLQVLGRRSAQYVNYDLFKNQGIPPMAILVSGGILTDESLEDLEKLVRGMRGLPNWNRIAIIESTGESVGLEERGSAKIELKNLSEYRKEDQMFAKYLETTKKDVRHRFRLPPLYVGATEVFTYACYDDQTETLTDRGWITIDDFKEGDRIATFNPETGCLEYHKPEEVYIYPAPNEMVSFNSPGVDVVVTKNHDIFIKKYICSSLPWEKMKAEEILKSPINVYLFRVAPDTVEPGIVPDNLPVSDEELAMRLIGYIVADGSIDENHTRIRFNAKRKRKKKAYMRTMRMVAEDIGAELVFRNDTSDGYVDIEIRGKKLHDFCEKNLLTDNREKKLPDWVWMLDYGLSKALLTSLMFGDRTWKHYGSNSMIYFTTSETLADQVQALAFRCGLRSRMVKIDDKRENRRSMYYIEITNTTTQMIKKEGIKVIQPTAKKVYCFHVKNHLFVVRRNGKISIHGNTARAAQTVAEEQVFIPERLDFDEKFNKFIVQRELGARLWKYKSKGPQIVGAEERRKGVETFAKAGALTINHAIEQANTAFGLEMSKFDAPWADYPIMIVEGLLKTGRLKGLDEIAEPAIVSAKQQLAQKNLLIPSATEKVLKSDMFTETEKELYKMLVGLQNAIEMINRCDHESSL